jgi:hypothetical protein
VRRATLVTIICLFLLLGVAAVYQMVLASRGGPAYPGPNTDTPYPTVVVTP